MKAPLNFLKSIGRKGGKSKSDKKLKAVLTNLAKAREIKAALKKESEISTEPNPPQSSNNS